MLGSLAQGTVFAAVDKRKSTRWLLLGFGLALCGFALVRSPAPAFVAMWRVLPGLQRVAAIASFPPCLWTLERVYLMFLRIRPTLQWTVRQLIGASRPLSQ